MRLRRRRQEKGEFVKQAKGALRVTTASYRCCCNAQYGAANPNRELNLNYTKMCSLDLLDFDYKI